MVAPRLQRRGVSRVMLAALRDYVARRREDGLPYDAWVRTHLRLGARILKVAPCSMVIAGTLAEWRRWTGLPFDKTGPAIVPGALSPIHVCLEQDHAVYVEPNLWIRHRLGTSDG